MCMPLVVTSMPIGHFCPIKSTVTKKLVHLKFCYTANCVAGENWNSSFPSVNLPIGHRQSIIVLILICDYW